MRALVIVIAFVGLGTIVQAQTLPLSDLMELVKSPPRDFSNYLGMMAYQQVADDTLIGIDDKTMLEHNMKWVYRNHGDTAILYTFFYKKKENKSTPDKGYFVNIQYSMACKACFKELKDSVIATGWPRVQDDHNDKQILQTYDAGNYSVMLFTHFKRQGEYYDIVVFRKKPVDD